MSSLPIRIKRYGPLGISLGDAAKLSLTYHNGTPMELPAGSSSV
jgi:hypothetical protein